MYGGRYSAGEVGHGPRKFLVEVEGEVNGEKAEEMEL